MLLPNGCKQYVVDIMEGSNWHHVINIARNQIQFNHDEFTGKSCKGNMFVVKMLYNQRSIAHVITIIKSEVSTSPIIIFFRGCVPEMLATSYSVTYCIYIPGKPGIFIVFIKIVQFMMSANSRIRFGLQIVFVCLYITPSHYNHCANLSEDIEFIKCLSDIFCRVCE